MRLRPDPFILALVATAALASVLPAPGDTVATLQVTTKIAIALLTPLLVATLMRGTFLPSSPTLSPNF